VPLGVKQALRVGGFVPLTTLDYPGHLACVLFCQGCAWRCRYCHNPGLIVPRGENEKPWPELLEFLRRRQGLLEAVVFSGGEPTLQAALPAAIAEVRELGFKIGLHSAGVRPQALARVLPLVDWVGFDVKALAEDTALITGVRGSGAANWRSLELLLASGVDYECRTTVHWHLLDCHKLLTLAQRLRAAGVERYVVQCVRTEQMWDPSLPATPEPLHLRELWETLEQLFPHFILRGQ
jgi:anaerobic ribonucleoside-triphosphate reductase activating protein